MRWTRKPLRGSLAGAGDVIRIEAPQMEGEIPPIESSCEKEVYAFFGLAAYCAQVFEHAALNLALVLRLPGIDAVSQDLFDDLYASLEKHTLGRLFRAAKVKVDISESDLNHIEEAVELRNILVHHFFKTHAEDFVSELGRLEMIKELQLIISKLKQADTLMENIYSPLWKMYGVTDQFIEREMEAMYQRATLRDASV